MVVVVVVGRVVVGPDRVVVVDDPFRGSLALLSRASSLSASEGVPSPPSSVRPTRRSPTPAMTATTFRLGRLGPVGPVETRCIDSTGGSAPTISIGGRESGSPRLMDQPSAGRRA